VQRGRLARSPRERLELGLDRTPDREPTRRSLDLERHGLLLDRDDLADELCQVGHRAAQLARPHVEQRLLLLVGRAIVDVDDYAPVALEDVPRDEGEDAEGPARDVGPVDRALVDVPREHACARPAVRVLADPTRAEHVARADLQQLPLELVRHVFLLT
jgi:hypothetical protein